MFDGCGEAGGDEGLGAERGVVDVDSAHTSAVGYRGTGGGGASALSGGGEDDGGGGVCGLAVVVAYFRKVSLLRINEC